MAVLSNKSADVTMPESWSNALLRVFQKVRPNDAGTYQRAFRTLVQSAGAYEVEAFESVARHSSTKVKDLWRMLREELTQGEDVFDNIESMGVRREVLRFNPGDLGTKVFPFRRPAELGEFAGCVQRPINSDRLKRLERVGLEVLAVESFTRPLVFFEGANGERRLAGGHHRLTLANMADHHTDWVIEVRTRASFPARGDWLKQLAALNLNEGGHVRTDQIVLHPNFMAWRPLLPENLQIYSGQDVSVFGILDGRTLCDWYVAEGRLRYKVNPDDRVETMSGLEGERLTSTVEMALKWRNSVVMAPASGKKAKKYLVSAPVIGAWFFLAERYPDRQDRMLQRIVQHLEFLDLTAKASVPDAAKALLALINHRVRSEFRLSLD